MSFYQTKNFILYMTSEFVTASERHILIRLKKSFYTSCGHSFLLIASNGHDISVLSFNQTPIAPSIKS